MKNTLLLTLFISFLFFNSCKESIDKPSDQSMKECLANHIENKIVIKNYQQIDGLSSEKDGVKYYEGYFNAEFTFISNYENFAAGDEYKIIKGVLKFIKTENGWNCMSFDFSNAELIQLNKFKKSENEVSNITDYQTQVNDNQGYSDVMISDDAIKRTIREYYRLVNNKEYSRFDEIFRYNVEQFFGKNYITVDEIINDNINYKSKWAYSELNILEDSFLINRNDFSTDVEYLVDYKVKKKINDNWKIFKLKMNVSLDNDLLIYKINEEKL